MTPGRAAVAEAAYATAMIGPRRVYDAAINLANGTAAVAYAVADADLSAAMASADLIFERVAQS